MGLLLMADEPNPKALLEQAIRDYVATFGEGDLLTDWFIIAATANMTSPDVTGYIHAASSPPYHTCIGLIEVARQRVDEECHGGGDDDE